MLTSYQQQLQDSGSISFAVRVRPQAARSRLTDILDDGSIKIDVAAVTEDGKANSELIAILAKEFGVSRENIDILSGKRGRRKLVRVRRA